MFGAKPWKPDEEPVEYTHDQIIAKIQSFYDTLGITIENIEQEIRDFKKADPEEDITETERIRCIYEEMREAYWLRFEKIICTRA